MIKRENVIDGLQELLSAMKYTRDKRQYKTCTFGHDIAYVEAAIQLIEDDAQYRKSVNDTANAFAQDSAIW
jgi:hypothetical protein